MVKMYSYMQGSIKGANKVLQESAAGQGRVSLSDVLSEFAGWAWKVKMETRE